MTKLRNFILMCVVASGMTSSAQAQKSPEPPPDESCKSNECAYFNNKSTLIPKALWSHPCDATLRASLDEKHFSRQPSVYSPPDFIQGVCLSEQIRRGLLPPGTTDGSGVGAALRGIDALQKAQSALVLPAQRMAATLFEGLLHCRALDELRNQADRTEPARQAHCFHRAQAKASFGRVDLAGVDIRYEPAESSDVLAEAMLSCQEKHLAATQDAECGLLSSPNDGELNTIADSAMSSVLSRYFGDIPDPSVPPDSDRAKYVPPISAMLSRKIIEVKATSEGSQKAFAELKTRRDRLQSVLDAVSKPFCNLESCVPHAAATIYDAYFTAYQNVQRLRSFIDRYIGGFFQDENKKDVLVDVKRAVEVASDTVRLLAAARPQLETLAKDLSDLSTQRDRGTAESLKGACQALFCELFAPPTAKLDIACRSADPDATGGKSIGNSNSLCGDQAAARELCRGVGFDEAADCAPGRTLVSMRPRTSRSAPRVRGVP